MVNSSLATLHLVVPGLFTPPGRPEAAGIVPQLPHLETLLARADKGAAPGSDHISTLFSLFGYPPPQQADRPSAVLCRLAEGGAPDNGYWLHAEPVHLKPDMDRLLLFPGRSLEIAPKEAEALGELLLEHFSDLEWRLERGAPERWYLRLPEPPELETHPLHRVIGRNLLPFLPQGDDGRRWRGLLNEIQMVLHHAEVNQARSAVGRPEINGLWLWGGGRLPTVVECGWQRVFADHPLAVGLARHAGVTVEGLPERPDSLEIAGDGLIYRDDLLQPVLDADLVAWGRELERLEPLLETLLGALSRKGVEALLLYPCNGRSYRITRSSLRRFWRRRKPIAHYCASSYD